VRINGSDPPPEAAADLIAVIVHEDIWAASMFALELINWDMGKLKVTWADDELFAEGSEVEIQMGYVDDLETLMIGEIIGLEPEFCTEEVPKVTVRGYDRRHRLMRDRKTRSFVQLKDSDIASQIAREADLTPQVEDSGVHHDYVLQHNQTDMEFLQERADRIGHEVVVENKTLYFRPIQHTEPKTLSLARGVDLMEFYPRLSAVGQVGAFQVRGWDPKGKSEIIGQAGIGDESTTMGGRATGQTTADDTFGQAMATSVNRPVLSQAEADQIALGRFRDMGLAYITGEGVCVGRKDLRAGTVVEVEGVGERFGGLYYVTSATHTCTPARGYRTVFNFRRNAT
jgi:phage protein D